jgi:hypothetical protein
MDEGTSNGRPGKATAVFGSLAFVAGFATLVLGWLAIGRHRAAGAVEASSALTVCIIAGVATLAFAAIAVSMATGWGWDRSIAQRTNLHPGKPWLWVRKWDGGRVEASHERGRSAGFLVLALFWNAAVVGAGILVYRSGPPEVSAVGLFLLVFALLGFVLLVTAARQLVAALRFAPAVFRMAEVPGVLGGVLSGTIETPANVPIGVDAKLTLKCIRYTSAGRSSMPVTLWQDEQRTATSAPMPITFTVPYDLPGTTPPGETSDATIRWELQVKASVPGVDWSAQFAVPVFLTEASDPSIKAR